ncbi:hypothetical protein PTKIN_Ptkin08bG0111200 [Pterospermum kingtungense]
MKMTPFPFLLTATGVTISDIIKPVYVPPIIHSFFPLNGLKNHEGITNPLLGIQVTDLADGIFIGCSINHGVADGTSFWHFINSWSIISKGSIRLSKSFVFNVGFSLVLISPFVFLNLVSKKQMKTSFHLLYKKGFSISQRKTLQNSKQKLMLRWAPTTSPLFKIFYPIFGDQLSETKSFDSNKETNYCVMGGARQRLQELPYNYFGNAILSRIVSMKAKEPLGQGIGNVAWQMNKIIATVTEKSLKKFLESWQASPTIVTMGSMTNSTMDTSGSPRFNMYGNDFGWGKPIAIRSGSANKFDGRRRRKY